MIQFIIPFCICSICFITFILLFKYKIIKNNLLNLTKEKNQLLEDYWEIKTNLIQKESQIISLERIISEKDKYENDLSNRLEFIGQKITTDAMLRISKVSESNMKITIDPLKDKITEFQTRIDRVISDCTKEQFSLKNEISKMTCASEMIMKRADNLTKALKGDVKLQGNWGEIMLEKILEESGLRIGRDYEIQKVIRNNDLYNNSTSISRPDAIIYLPENKCVIVDAKVSLVDYEKYISDLNQDDKSIHTTKLVNSIKKHIISLSEKKYEHKEGSIEFILMFMPIESSYSLALQHEPSLYNYAWDKGVIIVSPTTFFATLRVIALMWKVSRQNTNALEIAKLASILKVKMEIFSGEMDKMGKNIRAIDLSYDILTRQLSRGNKSIMSNINKLEDMDFGKEILKDSGDTEFFDINKEDNSKL